MEWLDAYHRTAAACTACGALQEEAKELAKEILIKEYEGHFENYAEYSKTYRSWMVAYGIGGPVLLLTNQEAVKRLVGEPLIPWIVGIFLAGLGLQILLAFANKWVAWYLYGGAFAQYQEAVKDPQATKFHMSRAYRFCVAASSLSWIDLLIDFSSLICFSVATYLTLVTVFPS